MTPSASIAARCTLSRPTCALSCRRCRTARRPFALEPATAPASELGDETALARDLLAALIYLRREKVPVRTMPFLSRQDVARLQPHLVGAQPATDAEQRLFFLQRLLQRAGMIVREGALLRPQPESQRVAASLAGGARAAAL